MKVEILSEAGFEEAMLGISLSYNSGGDMKVVADKLCFKGDGHNKFLEMIEVCIDITAPRYWWSQFDTYRVGVTKQSESTMHTVLDRYLTQDDFVVDIPVCYLDKLNVHIANKDLRTVKAWLPDGFLQRRLLKTNYMTLQRIIRQRRTHELIEWQQFCDAVLAQAEHPEFLEETK